MANNKRIFAMVGCGCLAAVLGVIALAGIAVAGFFALIKNSDPYKESLQRAGTHPAAIAMLGTPVEAGFMVMGNINLENENGTADFNYSVSGPNGAGTVYVTGTKTASAWNYTRMELKSADGETIDLQSAP